RAILSRDVRVGHGALYALHAGICGYLIAVVAEQAAPRGALGQEAVGAYVSVPHVHVPVLEAERRHRAVSVERVRIAHLRRELLVGADAIEGAVQLSRDLALDFEIEEVALQTKRLVDRHEGR